MLNDRKLLSSARSTIVMSVLAAGVLCLIAPNASLGGGWFEKGKDLVTRRFGRDTLPRLNSRRCTRHAIAKVALPVGWCVLVQRARHGSR